MTDPDNTTARDLVRAAEIGSEEGLNYIYAGNLPGKVGEWENTRCPRCRTTLIERTGYLVEVYHLTGDGACPTCQTRIPGVWPAGGSGEVRTGHGMTAFYSRLPRALSW